MGGPVLGDCLYACVRPRFVRCDLGVCVCVCVCVCTGAPGVNEGAPEDWASLAAMFDSSHVANGNFNRDVVVVHPLNQLKKQMRCHGVS